MKSLMVRLLMLLTAAMLLAIPGPAMAEDFDDLDNNDFGIGPFGIGDFGHNFNNNDDEDFDDDGDNLRVIDVGDSECLVEEDDDDEDFDEDFGIGPFGHNFNDDEDEDVELLFCDEDENDAQAMLDAFFERAHADDAA